MRIDNFEGEGVVICGHLCKTAEPMVTPFVLWARTGPRNHNFRWGPDPPREEAIWEKGSHCKVQGLSAVSCTKTAEPIDLLFGCGLGCAKEAHPFNRIRHVAPMCTTWRIRLNRPLRRFGHTSNYYDHLLL